MRKLAVPYKSAKNEMRKSYKAFLTTQQIAFYQIHVETFSFQSNLTF